jgi:cyclophilin family peptidyl-prolyl cis-trans isomerase
VTLNTTMGIIVIGLFDDMPITSNNFKNLTALGLYDGTIFHRVVQNFVIQGGDIFDEKSIPIPTIHDELPTKHSNIRGSVAMAKTSQPNSATSQFYINVADNTHLDTYGGGYSVFGQVTQGMDVVDNISNVTTDNNARPIQNVTLLKATLSGSVPEYSLLVYATLFIGATLLIAIVQRGTRNRTEPKTKKRASLLLILGLPYFHFFRARTEVKRSLKIDVELVVFSGYY